MVVDPDAIEAMRQLVARGVLDIDLDPEHPTDRPVTVDEVLTAIDRRIRRRLEAGGHSVYRSLAEQIEKLRQHVIRNAADSINFLKKALEVARLAVEAEKLEDRGKLDAAAERLLDPNVGALTRIRE